MDKKFNQNQNFGQNPNLNQNFNQNPNFNQFKNYGYVTTMRSNSSKQRIRSLILLICFTLTILITSVYAWFSTQKNVSINNLKGRVEVAEGLQISLDAETWGQSISFGENADDKDNSTFPRNTVNNIVASWADYDVGVNKVTSNNIRPYNTLATFTRGDASDATDAKTGYMLPVSCAGVTGTSDKFLTFYTGNYSGVKLSKISKQEELMGAGFYAFDVYLMNTTKGNEADKLYLNQDSMVREILRGTDTDYGLKNAVRVGLAFYDDGTLDPSSSSSQIASVSANKETILNKTKDAVIKKVAIWEPNYDTHSAYVLKQNAALNTLAEGKSTGATAINTYAVSSVPTEANPANAVSNVYKYDSTGLSYVKTLKTTGTVVKTQNSEGEDMNANGSGIKKLTAVDGTTQVALTANSISKLRVYVWLEGQDPDCINWASHSEGIAVDIGLIKASADHKFTDGQGTYDEVDDT